MSVFNRRLCGTALGLIVMSQAAYADLTASEVWEDWRSYIAGFGNEITANEALSGNVLTVTDLRIAMALPEGQGSGFISLERLDFAENSDGTVSVSIPDTTRIVSSMTPQTGETVAYTVNVKQDGLEMTAAGTAAQIRYEYAADRIDMTLAELILNGAVVPPQNAAFSASVLDIAGVTDMVMASMRNFSQSMTARSLTFDIKADTPENQSQFAMTSAVQDVSYTGSGSVPLSVVQTSDMLSMLKSGFAVDGVFTLGAGNISIAANSPDGKADIATSSQGSTIEVNMSADGVSYRIQQRQALIDVSVPDLPFPLSLAMETAGVNLTMPIQKTDESSAFAFGFTLGNFTMSDGLWSIFDPAAKLPRDPATLVLDLTGKARLLFDFLDPSAAVVSGDPDITPAEIESLNINSLQLKLVGAELTGTGAFAFENAPGGGMPKPEGALNLKLVGGNGLLDNLVAGGLLPEQQAMSARMMMGLFSVPSSEPDTLTSKIEVNREGHVIANGQRIR